jgi:hypothetical protein
MLEPKPLPLIRNMAKQNAKRVTLTLVKDPLQDGQKIAVFYSPGLAYDFALQMREHYRGYHSVEIS